MATTCWLMGPQAAAEAVRAQPRNWCSTSFPRSAPARPSSSVSLLADAGASVAYITSPDAARQAVAEIVAGAPDVVGLDFETEVLPAFRQPIPVRFNEGRKPRRPTAP